jgi:2-isopropylmalate synthase
MTPIEHVRIFDTTLRDGEQAAGGALTIDEKLDLGLQLARLGVDVIEAGFPHTSAGDFEAVQLLAREIQNCQIAALSGIRLAQIDTTGAALKNAANPLLHTVISTSDIHLQRQLKVDRDGAIKMAVAAVKRAKDYCSDVEFSAMDATRSDPDYVCQMFAAAIDAGATVINVPDTLGYCQPGEFGSLVKYVMTHTPGIESAIVSIHCHDDLGMAVASSLSGILAGARQVECTINGVGERAGNAALEEIVMALNTRRDFYKLTTGIDTTQLYRTSRMVSNYMAMPVQPNKAIVGANAFSHASGLHQDGMLKDRTTYEIMTPQSVGVDTSRIVLGKTSGRHAVRARIQELGYKLSDEEFKQVFASFKTLADKKRQIFDKDLEVIIIDETRPAPEIYALEHVQVSCGNHNLPTATVRLRFPDGQIVADADLGTGPVDAVYRTINRIVHIPNDLIEFSVEAVTEGIDAVGEVTIRIQTDGQIYTGRGANTDIIVAAAKAYMNALNKLVDAMHNNEEKIRL